MMRKGRKLEQHGGAREWGELGEKDNNNGKTIILACRMEGKNESKRLKVACAEHMYCWLFISTELTDEMGLLARVR